VCLVVWVGSARLPVHCTAAASTWLSWPTLRDRVPGSSSGVFYFAVRTW